MRWELSVTEQRYRAVLEVMAWVPVTEVAGASTTALAASRAGEPGRAAGVTLLLMTGEARGRWPGPAVRFRR